MSTQAALGKAALDAKDYAGAIKHLTTALESSPKSPLWLIQRSTAYQRSNQHELALADAENAVLAARERARREFIATAQFRRALALYGLKRYGDARLCLVWCYKINEKEKGLTLWQGMVKQAYEAAGGDDSDENKITVLEVPEPVKEVRSKKTDSAEKGVDTDPVTDLAKKPSVLKSTPKEKIRHEWYQSGRSVDISLFAAGVDKTQVEVTFEERSLEVTFPVLDSGSTYDFTLSPLYGSIDTAQSSYRVTPRKIEITLVKKQSLKWGYLEWKAGANSLEPDAPVITSSVPAAPLKDVSNLGSDATAKGPSYPTSSRTGPKDWDAIVGDDEDEDAQDPDHFFKKLYKNADDNTKKAMMKSMQESGGTSLSTSWNDVSSKTFTPSPPDGMEAKKWEH